MDRAKTEESMQGTTLPKVYKGGEQTLCHAFATLVMQGGLSRNSILCLLAVFVQKRNKYFRIA